MLSTGIRTPVGIKVAGPDLAILERLGKEIEAVVRQVPGTRSVYAERVMGGNYIDFEIDRAAIARYGLTVADVQDVIQSAIGGMDITTTVEGLERYAVTLRYSRELRDDLPALANVLVETPAGQQLPLGQFAELKYVLGADMIRSEDARPNAWIYVDVSTQDIGGYVARAQQAVREQINLPAGYTLGWSGQYEYMQRAEQRLLLIVPLTLLIIVVILYLNTRSLFKTALVILTVPFSIAGGIWLLYLLDYNMSIAVWVGLIALAGLDAETSVVILLYLDLSYEEFRQKGLLRDRNDLADAVYHGAVKRIRPKMMTITTTIVGLLPILWSEGTGADVMKRIAAPMVGGLVTSGIMELAIYPVIYYLWKQHELPPAGPFRGFRHLRA
jgi:Cu(I)/Ag(I) efflux system membrane protein CusA/SilA